MKIKIFKADKKSRRIKVFIPFEMRAERELFKTIDEWAYHKYQKRFSIPNLESNLNLLKTIFKGRFIEIEEQSKPTAKYTLNTESVEAMYNAEQKLVLKAYSLNTITNYLSELKAFFKYFESYDHNSITKEQIESYIYYMVSKYKMGESKQNLAINAIKFYFEQVIGQPREYYDIQRPKKSHQLPNVLSEGEVKKLINSPCNPN
jgi:integrase/recombinase XerD